MTCGFSSSSILVASPRFSLSCGIFTGYGARRGYNHLFCPSSAIPNRGRLRRRTLGETGYCWEMNRAQDVVDVLMAIAPMFTANRPSLCQVENLLIGLFTGSLVVVVAPFHKLLLIKYFVESVACFPPSNVAHRILQAA
jgi:hypothetical protein